MSIQWLLVFSCLAWGSLLQSSDPQSAPTSLLACQATAVEAAPEFMEELLSELGAASSHVFAMLHKLIQATYKQGLGPVDDSR